MITARAGFTLLEICLALLIGAMLTLLAVPSISGLLAERRLKQAFEHFDHLVTQARQLSVEKQQSHALVWTEEGILLRSATDGKIVDAGRLGLKKDETFALARPAALVSRPGNSWAFWENGTCEPAVISYQGPSGHWQVRYDALTAHAVFELSSTR